MKLTNSIRNEIAVALIEKRFAKPLAALQAFSTTEKLAAAWPAIRPFIPASTPASTALVPVDQIKALNEELGL